MSDRTKRKSYAIREYTWNSVSDLITAIDANDVPGDPDYTVIIKVNGKAIQLPSEIIATSCEQAFADAERMIRQHFPA